MLASEDEAYGRGFRVGLSTHDEPVRPLGTVLQTIKGIERFIDSEGPSWITGFWDGLDHQIHFEEAVRLTGEAHGLSENAE